MKRYLVIGALLPLVAACTPRPICPDAVYDSKLAETFDACRDAFSAPAIFGAYQGLADLDGGTSGRTAPGATETPGLPVFDEPDGEETPDETPDVEETPDTNPETPDEDTTDNEEEFVSDGRTNWSPERRAADDARQAVEDNPASTRKEIHDARQALKDINRAEGAARRAANMMGGGD